VNINIKEGLINKEIFKEKVVFILNIGKLWQKGKGLYVGDFSNGNKHGRG
jgi:hypothetical protein